MVETDEREASWGTHLRLDAVVVVLHALVNLVHGIPHVVVPVPLAPWQGVFIGTIVFATPLAGLWLAWRGRQRVGGMAVLLGGLGSFVFATYHHFFSETPDNVAAVTGPWSLPFSMTAVGISLLALATAVAGGWLVRQSSAQGRSRSSRSDRIR